MEHQKMAGGAIGFESTQDHVNQFKYQGAQAGNAPVPRTLNSAAGRLDALNERLSKAVEGLAMVSSQIGAMTPVNGQNNAKSQTSACGAVPRLNDAADEAHAKLGEIENYINSLQRALG
jgi:hypothetical protein